MSKKTTQARSVASFIESMECLPVSKIPEAPEWTYEILCGGPHKISYVALEVMSRADNGQHIYWRIHFERAT
jgi:hypothetical protein